MKDYKSIVEQRRADHDRAAAEIRATIDENNAKIEKLYVTQAKSVVTGDSAAYSTAENEIKFLKATNDQQQKKLEELKAACVLFNTTEYSEALADVTREYKAKRAAMITEISEKWKGICKSYQDFRNDAEMANATLRYLQKTSGSDDTTAVNTALEVAGWIQEAGGGRSFYQAFNS